jgi:hypothetical protein
MASTTTRPIAERVGPPPLDMRRGLAWTIRVARELLADVLADRTMPPEKRCRAARILRRKVTWLEAIARRRTHKE